MSPRAFSIIALLISIKSFSQFDPKMLVGKWKLVSGKNKDTTIIYQTSNQYYIQYFKSGNYRETHIRNEKWNGKSIKGTYYTVGKWKIVDSLVTMYDRRPEPPRKHVTYRDYSDTLISLNTSEMYIISQLNEAGEGAEGTLFYKKIQ